MLGKTIHNYYHITIIECSFLWSDACPALTYKTWYSRKIRFCNFWSPRWSYRLRYPFHRARSRPAMVAAFSGGPSFLYAPWSRATCPRLWSCLRFHATLGSSSAEKVRHLSPPARKLLAFVGLLITEASHLPFRSLQRGLPPGRCSWRGYWRVSRGRQRGSVHVGWTHCWNGWIWACIRRKFVPPSATSFHLQT